MITDKYGQTILTELDLCDAYLENPDRTIRNCFIDKSINFSDELELENIPDLVEYVDPLLSVEEYDRLMQNKWLMPQEYLDLDIAKWLLEQCQTDVERQRVGEELLLYLDRNLFPLLQYLKYLVDTMRSNNIVWGVGRGSSVASYCLYLIGIHKIDSIYYSLDINEFLR